MGVLRVKVGGNWVDVGSHLDEVYVGVSAPTDPNTELWFDSDAPTPSMPNVPSGGAAGAVLTKNSINDYDTAWSVSRPLGYVGNRDQSAADFALAATGWQDVPGMTAISFTPSGSRWYRFTFFGTIKLTGAGGNPVVIAGIHDGSTQVWVQEIYVANQSTTTPSVPFNISAVRLLSNPGTYKPQVYSNGSGASLMGLGGRAARFSIEDIGGA